MVFVCLKMFHIASKTKCMYKIIYNTTYTVAVSCLYPKINYY